MRYPNNIQIAQSRRTALPPSYVKVDGRSEKDILSFMAEYARLLNFYDQSNEVQGNWKPFLLKDPVILLAYMANTRYAEYYLVYQNILRAYNSNTDKLQNQSADEKLNKIQQMSEDDYAKLLNDMFNLLEVIFLKLIQWLTSMVQDPNNERICYDLKSFMIQEVQQTYAQTLWATLNFRSALNSEKVSEFIQPTMPPRFQNLDNPWTKNTTTGPFYQTLELNTSVQKTKDGTKKEMINLIWKDRENTLSGMEKTTNKVFSFFVKIIQSAEEYYEKIQKTDLSLPDTGLIRTFAHLFNTQQQELNKISKRHLDFYYKSLLKQSQLPSSADSAFLMLELKDKLPFYALKKGTLFNAGVDGAKNPITFSTDKDQILNAGALESAYKMSVSDKELLCFEQVKTPTKLQLDETGKAIPWQTFESSTQASFGFAFASPLLYLQDGNRTINITLLTPVVSTKASTTATSSESGKDPKNKTNPKSETENKEKEVASEVEAEAATTSTEPVANQPDHIPLSFDAENCKIYLSTSSKWIEVTPITTTNSATWTIKLNAEDPAIEVFKKNPDGLKSKWPMLKVVFSKYDQLLDPPVISAVKIDVAVSNKRQASFYNDHGKMDTSKPFQLFGPVAGFHDTFYLGSNEIFSKPVQKLSFQMYWDKVPSPFTTYYEEYNSYYCDWLNRDSSTTNVKYKCSGSSTKDANLGHQTTNPTPPDSTTSDGDIRIETTLSTKTPESEKSEEETEKKTAAESTSNADKKSSDPEVKLPVTFDLKKEEKDETDEASSSTKKEDEEKAVTNPEVKLPFTFYMDKREEEATDPDPSKKDTEEIKDDADATGERETHGLVSWLGKVVGNVLGATGKESEGKKSLALGGSDPPTTTIVVEPLFRKDSFKIDFDWLEAGAWEDMSKVLGESLDGSAEFLFNYPADAKPTEQMSNYSFAKKPNPLTNIVISDADLPVFYHGNPSLQLNPLTLTEKTVDGFLKMQLTGPDEGFGTEMYPKVINYISIFNGNDIVNNNGNALKKGAPSLPFVPKLSRIEVSYNATETYVMPQGKKKNTFDSFQYFYYTPFGSFEVEKLKDLRVVQPVPYNGNLILGFSNLTTDASLNLFFELTGGTEQFPDTGGNPLIQYWSSEGWKKMKVMSDGTKGMRCSGVLTVQCNQEMLETIVELPKKQYWIQISTDNPSVKADTVYMNVNGIKVNRVTSIASEDPLSLAKGTIKGPFIPTPEIKKTEQIFPTFGGVHSEDYNQMLKRVSTRLTTKARATSAQDYYDLILQKFPNVYFTQVAKTTGGKDDSGIMPLTLQVARAISDPNQPGAFRPNVVSCELEEIQEYITKRSSPHVKLAVQNFQMEEVTIRCKVNFAENVAKNELRSQIMKQLDIYLSPWIESDQTQRVINQPIQTGHIKHFLMKIDGVLGVEMLNVKYGEVAETIVETEQELVSNEPIKAIATAQVNRSSINTNTVESNVLFISSMNHNLDYDAHKLNQSTEKTDDEG